MAKRTILIVDDVEINRAILSTAFEEDYNILEAENGRDALEIMESHPYSISAVLLDIIMPVMDGFEVLEEMKRRGLIRNIPVFLITADNSSEAMRKGYDLGVMDIIQKPITPYFIRRRVGNVIKLNNMVVEQESVLRKQEKEIRELNRSILETLSTAIEFRSCESGEHVVRMSNLTLVLMKTVDKYYPEYSVGEARMQVIADAAVMHDVGKIAIPDHILNKPGRLTPEEFEIMKTHTIRGCELLDSVPHMKDNPIYKYAYDICRHHHERWDGRGYPDGLKGNEINIWSQIAALADVYDALVSDRVYKKACSHEKALDMITGGECGSFNPMLLDCLRKAESDIRKNYAKKE